MIDIFVTKKAKKTGFTSKMWRKMNKKEGRHKYGTTRRELIRKTIE